MIHGRFRRRTRVECPQGVCAYRKPQSPGSCSRFPACRPKCHLTAGLPPAVLRHAGTNSAYLSRNVRRRLMPGKSCSDRRPQGRGTGMCTCRVRAGCPERLRPASVQGGIHSVSRQDLPGMRCAGSASNWFRPAARAHYICAIHAPKLTYPAVADSLFIGKLRD
jgi:hypothetical protein